MDDVTAYLYGSLDTDIYMKVPEALKLPENHQSREMFFHKAEKVTLWTKTIWKNVV